MDDRTKALECLNVLDPRALTYDEWLRVGLALKESGASAADWERWSANDPKRYHNGECTQKWESFRQNGSPVTLGSLVAMVQAQGGRLPEEFFGQGETREEDKFGWDDYIIHAPKAPPAVPRVVDPNYLEAVDIPPPADDFAPGDLIRYLQLMFDSNEHVGIVTESWQKDGEGRHLPKKGFADKTCGQLVEELRANGSDIGAVIGDVNPEAGGWIRINPLDGTGEVRDSNVTAFRHALLEADSGDLETQLATITELQLPCTAIVHSGGKSIHALVRVDAPDMAEYRKRVDMLYKIAEKNGIKPDVANRNPSRLSRLPGVYRGDRPQYIIATKAGKATWQEWVEWIEDLKDDLPDPVSITSIFSNPPVLAPTLIDGLLRTGHKMLLTGPSKAGKSFSMLQLSIAIAEGRDWLGWQCRQGNVLYVNLELDAPSCEQRIIEVYRTLGLAPKNAHKIDVWHLRGRSVPMDRLAPKLIRRATAKGYAAVIIDPIYKIITGDENSAEDMGRLCNAFDRICAALNCSVIYAHHHSKGSQGAKRAIDRASGSGVFGRDPDAVIDLIELDITDDRRARVEDAAALKALQLAIDFSELADKEPPDDALYDVHKLLAWTQQEAPHIGPEMAGVVCSAREPARLMTGLRVEATVREFAPPPRRNVWFKYPLHVADDTGLLQDAKAEGEEPPWMAQQRAKAKIVKERQTQKERDLIQALEDAGGVGVAETKDVASRLGVAEKTVRRNIEKLTDYVVRKGRVVEAKEGEGEE